MTPSNAPTTFREQMSALVHQAGAAWLKNIHKDQFNRWFLHQGVPVEAYRAAVPALQADHKAYLGLIEREFQLRLDFGEQQSPAEFLQRFPEHAAALHAKLNQLSELKSQADEPSDSASPAESHTDTDSGDFPTRLGGFQLHGLLGEGGQGRVFRAYDRRLTREVALKVLRSDLLDEQGARQRFEREAQKLAAVRSDHVVTLFQSGTVAGQPFLVMELLQGEPLCRRLERRLLSWQEAARIGLETARGLEDVHRCHIIHRDIKPSNIWMEDRTGDPAGSPRERVKILDFGLARTLRVDEHPSKGFAGTAAYCSPEQASCAACDHRTDLFSLGCVLYHMVTGRQPFTGQTRRDVLRQVESLHPPLASDLAPEAPSDLSGLIERLMAKDPGQRPASAEEVVHCLSCCLRRPEAEGDPQLADVLGSWPLLPAAIRAAIATLVQGCRSQPGPVG